MNVTPELDTRFRAAALREGLVDVRFDVCRLAGRRAARRGDRPRALPDLVLRPDGWRRSSRARSASACCASPLDDVRRELDEYFEGKRREFDLPLDLRVAPFHAEVLRELALRPLRPHRHVRRARGEGRPAARGPRRRHGDEPQPDPDRPAVPPHRRRERLAHRLRRRARREADAARSSKARPCVVDGTNASSSSAVVSAGCSQPAASAAPTSR